MPVDYTPLILVVLIACVPAFAAFRSTSAFVISAGIVTTAALVFLFIDPEFVYLGLFFYLLSLTVGLGIRLDKRGKIPPTN
jgi:hypothetical protein